MEEETNEVSVVVEVAAILEQKELQKLKEEEEEWRLKWDVLLDDLGNLRFMERWWTGVLWGLRKEKVLDLLTVGEIDRTSIFRFGSNLSPKLVSHDKPGSPNSDSASIVLTFQESSKQLSSWTHN